MSISVRDAGVWKEAEPWVRDGGVWKPVQKGFVRDDGVWKEFYTATQPIEFIDHQTAAANSLPTMPVHLPGDLLLVRAVRGNSHVPPTLPSGWTNIATGEATGSSARMAYKFATTSSETSGTWNNASGLSIFSVRNVSAIGGHSVFEGSVGSGSGNINEVVLQSPPSVVFAFNVHGFDSLPDGMERVLGAEASVKTTEPVTSFQARSFTQPISYFASPVAIAAELIPA